MIEINDSLEHYSNTYYRKAVRRNILMKARIKKTGEIVNIAEHATIELEMCDSYSDPVCLVPEDILENNNE